jgi:AcrR family transcriptional regulator
MPTTALGQKTDGAWLAGYGREEEELIGQLPDSPRLRRLLRDLETIMMSEGFLHLSTDDLARRLRCSKATLYRLADSREALLELVVSRWLARLRDNGCRELAAAEGWPAKLIGYLHAVKSQTKDASHRFMHDLREFPGGYHILMDHQRRRIELLETIIAGGVEAGDFQEVHPRLAAELILTSVRRAVEPDFLENVGLTLAEAFDEWYRILEFGLIKQTGKRRPSKGNGHEAGLRITPS